MFDAISGDAIRLKSQLAETIPCVLLAKWLVTRAPCPRTKRFVPFRLCAAGNGQWINFGETRASVKQICNIAAQHARRIYSGVGDFRREGKGKKGGDRFRCATRGIDVKARLPPFVRLRDSVVKTNRADAYDFVFLVTRRKCGRERQTSRYKI